MEIINFKDIPISEIFDFNRFETTEYIICIVLGLSLVLCSLLIFKLFSKKPAYRKDGFKWNKYIGWSWWLSCGWILGVHRSYLRSNMGIFYPILIFLFIALNINEFANHLFYEFAGSPWSLSTLTWIVIGSFGLLWIFDFFWIPWKCYVLRHKYLRQSPYQAWHESNTQTPDLQFAYQAQNKNKEAGSTMSKVLNDINNILNRRYTESKAWYKRGWTMLTNWQADPWLKFEKNRAEEVDRQVRIAQGVQNDYSEMLKSINYYLEEGRMNARHNFNLAYEAIAVLKATQRNSANQLIEDKKIESSSLALYFNNSSSEINVDIKDEDLIKGITMALSTTSGMMVLSSAWAGPIGLLAGAATVAFKYFKQAQEASKNVNQNCSSALNQLHPITEEMLKSENKINESCELLIALAKCDQAFWNIYSELRDKIYGEKPSFVKFITLRHEPKKIKNLDEDIIACAEDLIKVCNDYKKINDKIIK